MKKWEVIEKAQAIGQSKMKSARIMTVVLLTVFTATGCSQQKNMPEHERLSSQAEYVSQLIGDAIPLLERYKKTKSPADAERYDEQVSKIETQWLKLLDYEQIADDRKTKESSEKNGNIHYDKQTVLNNGKITMQWVLRALRKYKDDPERGRIIAPHFITTPQKLASEIQKELTYQFRD